MATKKYNPQGGLNWSWVFNDIENNRINKMKHDVDVDAEIIDYISNNYSDGKYSSLNNNSNNEATNNYIVMCSKIDLNTELETKFNFIKSHNGCEEDLEIAKFVVSVS